jgi:hypothetical protein
MGKNVSDLTLDAALNYIKSNVNKLFVLSSEPTGGSAYANMIGDYDSSGYRLADSGAISSSAFTGPGDGSTSGRKLTVNAQSSMSIDGVASSANATHVAIGRTHASSASSQLVIYTTTCTSQGLTGANKVNTPAWDIEIRDPS